MSEHPILFSAPMVRAILDGRKTQTRRVIKQQQPKDVKNIGVSRSYDKDRLEITWLDCDEDEWPTPISGFIRCPYGRPGDHLWVRESFTECPVGNFIYREQETTEYGKSTADANNRWKPSIHMPRRASRILLEISELYVERLKDISYEDAKAEGVAPFQPPYLDDSYTFVEDYRGGFIKLWESINGQGSFGLNPCVWVIEFKRVTP